MLKKDLLFKKLTTVVMTIAIIGGSSTGVLAQNVQAKSITKSSVSATVKLGTRDYQSEEQQLLEAQVSNTNFVYSMPNMTDVYRWAIAQVRTSLDVRSEPNGYLIGSVYNNDLVDVYDTYIDENGVEWALVKYMITGTNKAKEGWVHYKYLSYI